MAKINQTLNEPTKNSSKLEESMERINQSFKDMNAVMADKFEMILKTMQGDFRKAKYKKKP